MTKYKELLPGLLILLAAGVMYRKYQDKFSVFDNEENEKLIQKYLLTDNLPSGMKKPILWIHIPYKLNARIWKSFGSRNTENLNEPYLYLTIKSIITKCSNSFRICLIDDNSFSQLLPSFNVDFSKIPDPLDENIRTLSKLRLLKMYGGMFVPPSFACSKNLKSLFNQGISNGKMFFCEDVAKTSACDFVTMFPSSQFMGCEKSCPQLDQCMEYLQSLISRDSTAESRFDGNFDRFIYSLYLNKSVNVLPGTIIGAQDEHNEPILIDHLMNDSEIELSKNNYGIIIPHDDLLIRLKYKYFVYLSIPEILESDTFIGKYINNMNLDVSC